MTSACVPDVKPVRQLFAATTLFLIATLGAAHALASVENAYIAAREAFQKKQTARFEQQAARIPADHPLAPYVRFWRLQLGRTDEAAMLAFIERHADTPLSNRVRGDLALQYARAGDWQAFGRQYALLHRPDQELQCHDLRARMLAGEASAERDGLTLWRTPRDLPSSCDAVFALLDERGLLSTEERLRRLRLALDTDNLRLARDIDARLPPELRMVRDALTSAQADATRFLARAANTPGQREAALYALTRVARDDPEAAARLWESRQDDFTEDEWRYGWGQIALHAARRHDGRALRWFYRAGPPHSELQAQWRARAALRAGAWPDVYHAIQAMPETLRDQAVWRYWRARALKELNAPSQANQLFAPLSREIHYYGLLAQEELPVKLEARPAEYKVTPDDMRQIESLPGLRRALLLRRAGDPANAVAEWDWALRGLDDRLILAAAELARRENWHDRAIVTAERTRELHDFDLRYIAPYRDLASAYSSQHGLDEAWVYGLMRQESRFVEHARSSVGAQGLMQIMPATARWISDQLGLKRGAQAAVRDPETNIRFGTWYLRHVYDSLHRSPVLATAAYNAGPGRARRWQAEEPLEGAIYVETIPFVETREYVKKVMANAMFYRARFGAESLPLKEHLGVIPARASAARIAADTTGDERPASAPAGAGSGEG